MRFFLIEKKKQRGTEWKSLRIFGGSGDHFRYGFFGYFLLILPHYHWSLSSHPTTWASLVYFVAHWVVLDPDLLSCLPLFWFFLAFLCSGYPSPYPLRHLLNKSNIHHHPPTNIGSHGDFRKTESRTTPLLPFSRVSCDWIGFKPWRDWCREKENGPIAWRLWLLHCCLHIFYQKPAKIDQWLFLWECREDFLFFEEKAFWCVAGKYERFRCCFWCGWGKVFMCISWY